MSEDVAPYGATGDPAVARTEELRALIAQLGWSQREAAEALEVDTRTMRYWCAANPPAPLMAILALKHLLSEQGRELSDNARERFVADSE